MERADAIAKASGPGLDEQSNDMHTGTLQYTVSRAYRDFYFTIFWTSNGLVTAIELFNGLERMRQVLTAMSHNEGDAWKARLHFLELLEVLMSR